MKIGDEVYVHGYIDEIRYDDKKRVSTIIIRNGGGYFGTVPSEIDRKTEPSNSEIPNNSTISILEQVEDEPKIECLEWYDKLGNYHRYPKDEPQTEPLPKTINGVRIADAVAWADKWLEDNPVSEMWDMIRTLRDATEWQDEPQADCPWK